MAGALDFEGLDGILAAALDEPRAPVSAPRATSTSALDIEGLDGILPAALEAPPLPKPRGGEPEYSGIEQLLQSALQESQIDTAPEDLLAAFAEPGSEPIEVEDVPTPAPLPEDVAEALEASPFEVDDAPLPVAVAAPPGPEVTKITKAPLFEVDDVPPPITAPAAEITKITKAPLFEVDDAPPPIAAPAAEITKITKAPLFEVDEVPSPVRAAAPTEAPRLPPRAPTPVPPFEAPRASPLAPANTPAAPFQAPRPSPRRAAPPVASRPVPRSMTPSSPFQAPRPTPPLATPAPAGSPPTPAPVAPASYESPERAHASVPPPTPSQPLPLAVISRPNSQAPRGPSAPPPRAASSSAGWARPTTPPPMAPPAALRGTPSDDIQLSTIERPPPLPIPNVQHPFVEAEARQRRLTLVLTGLAAGALIAGAMWFSGRGPGSLLPSRAHDERELAAIVIQPPVPSMATRARGADVEATLRDPTGAASETAKTDASSTAPRGGEAPAKAAAARQVEIPFGFNARRPDRGRVLTLVDRVLPCAQHLVVVGHTCTLGSERANVRVGRARARAVAAMLEARGVPADDITVRSAGSKQPRYTNQTPSGRRRNRRVEVTCQAKP